MKFSFVTKTATDFTFQGNPRTSWDISTIFAIDTEKIVSWSYVEGDLHLWFVGIQESLCLREDSPQLGSKDNFLALLLYLRSEYQNFNDWNTPYIPSPTA